MKRLLLILLAGLLPTAFTLRAAVRNWLTNGEFTSGLMDFETHLTGGAEAQLLPTGFESVESLRITAPEGNTADQYLSVLLPVDPAQLTTRHFRATWWMKVNALPDQPSGGAGMRVRFLDVAGREIGADGSEKLHNRRTAEMNEWQRIDFLKDMWYQNYALEFDIPEGCRTLRLDIGLFGIAGDIEADRLILRNQLSVEESLVYHAPVTLNLSGMERRAVLDSRLFTINADYFHDGVVYGTLPATDSENRRAEFLAALRQAGIRALRFPGGMPCHYYQPDGAAYQTAREQNRRYPEALNVIRFCTENGLGLIWQTNDLTYVDATGEVKTIFDNPKADDSPNRLGEAAQALKRFLNSIPADCAVATWEIGNEDFALMSVGNYARLVDTFVPVILERFPEAQIIVTANVWPTALAERLKASGTAAKVHYMAAHYPWGDHWHPTAYEAPDNRDPRRLLQAELSWDLNAEAHLRLARSGGVESWRMAGSETNVYPFQVWDDYRVMYTPAQGLNFAHQWIEAMTVPSIDILAFHDLDSPYFGMIPFNVRWDGAEDRFQPVGDLRERPADCPEEYWRPRQYLVMPTALAMGMLSRHAGQELLAVDAPSPEVALDNFDFCWSRGAGEYLLTVVNRSGETREVTLNCDTISDMADDGIRRETLSWTTLDARPGAETRRFGSEVLEHGVLKTAVPPFSINQWQLRRKDAAQ